MIGIFVLTAVVGCLLWALYLVLTAPEKTAYEAEKDIIADLKDKESAIQAKRERLLYEAQVNKQQTEVNELEEQLNDETNKE